MTKDELIRQWAEYPGDTVLAVAGEHGQPVDIGEVEPGITIGPGGRRHYLQFNANTEDDDDD